MNDVKSSSSPKQQDLNAILQEVFPQSDKANRRREESRLPPFYSMDVMFELIELVHHKRPKKSPLTNHLSIIAGREAFEGE